MHFEARVSRSHDHAFLAAMLKAAEARHAKWRSYQSQLRSEDGAERNVQ